MTSSQSSSSRPIIRLPTVEAYNRWADVYDHDGNILQLHDDLAFAITIPSLLITHPPQRLLDLGCGTGRNTVKLFRALPANATIIAIDMSEGMVRKAQERLSLAKEEDADNTTKITWIFHDMNDKSASLLEKTGVVDAAISTLALEHLDLDLFFAAVAAVLKKGGWLFLTNMHPEQGAVSRAGFVDNVNGKEVKVQGVSFNYQINEILEAARRVGLELEDEVKERGVDDTKHAKELGKRAEKWIGVKMHVEMTFFMQRLKCSAFKSKN